MMRRTVLQLLLLPVLCFWGLVTGFATKPAMAGDCKPPSVLMSLPDTRDSEFWGPYADFAEAVAANIGVDLTVDFAARNDRFDYVERLRQSLAGAEKPDYVAAFPYFGAVQVLFDEAAATRTRVVTLNSDLGHRDRKEVGYPRERYKNWVLQSQADDESAGYDLTAAVVDAARDRFHLSAADAVYISAMGGNQMAASSLYRRDGLERYIRNSNGLSALNQFVFTDWSYERGREVAVGLIQRYPSAKAVWAANLPLGLAVSDAWNALTDGGLAPAIGAVSGPFDERALDAIKDGSFSAVTGGHFLEGGIVLVLLLDHFNGMDFVSEIGTGLRVPFQTVTAANIDAFRGVLGTRDWRGYDYAHLSKCHNPGLVHYDFSLPSVLRR